MAENNGLEYMPKEEVISKWQYASNISDEDLLSIDDVEFRARVRERSHHTLEIQVYHAAYRNEKLSPTQADLTKRLLKLWASRIL